MLIKILAVIGFYGFYTCPLYDKITVALDIKILLETLFEKIRNLEDTVEQLRVENTGLRATLAVYKNKKTSNNSHTSPSKDENRPLKNQSLREKTDKNVGGQPGHEGKTLECSDIIDKTLQYIPNYCNCCGQDLADVTEYLIETRQVIDIPVIKPLYTEHRIYRKTCTCGHNTESDFPAPVAAKVQYGPNVESLVGYLHARQYLPYQRMKEFFEDVMGLPVSVGGINNILNRLIQKAIPHYEQIKQRLYEHQFQKS